MMSQPKPVIQRLWYTAPRLGTARKGGEEFRVCAVTRELQQDFYQGGALERALERYARYTRPDGTDRNDISRLGQHPDPFTVPGAPICLSLIEIEDPRVWENKELYEQLSGRVLVNKVYVAGEGDGRSGNFFIDLLANLPDGFSAREALALWRSEFWQTTYISRHPGYRQILEPVTLPRGLELEMAKRLARRTSGPLSLSVVPETEPLGRVLDPFAPALHLLEDKQYAHTREQLRRLLTFLIHAYLQQQHEDWGKREERNRLKSRLRQLKAETPATPRGRIGKQDIRQQEYQQQEYQLLNARLQALPLKRIFLAAEDDLLACCLVRLAWLFEHIPGLLEPLTFSTYEYDVCAGECLVVGTAPAPNGHRGSKDPEQLLPESCYTQGFAYNAYSPAHNTELTRDLPFIASFARFAAGALLKARPDKDTRILALALEKAGGRLARTAPPGPPSLAWQFLDICGDIIFGPASYNRQEIEETFDDSSKWYRLELPGVRRRIFQWVVADSKGLDLDQPAPASMLPFSWRPASAKSWLTSRCLPCIERFVRRGTGEPEADSLRAILAAEVRELLEEYAERRLQPAPAPDHTIGLDGPQDAGSQQPQFDVIESCKTARFPEPFEALLDVLDVLEPLSAPEDSVPGSGQEHAALLEYLLTLENSGQRLTFRCPEAGAFVLRHLDPSDLLLNEHAARPEQTAEAQRIQEWAACHWRIHRRLLDQAASVLSEDQQTLISPLLCISFAAYSWLFADLQRLRWPRWLRAQALGYQLNQLQVRGQSSRFTAGCWETHPISQQEINEHRASINSQWQLHRLLLEEAQACLHELDGLKAVQPLLAIDERCFGEFLEIKLYPEWNYTAIIHLLFPLEDQPFQAESQRSLEAHIADIESLILQQTGVGTQKSKETAIDFYEKLIQSGCAEANALRLLQCWHHVWQREKISTHDLRRLLASTSRLGPASLQKLLDHYYQVYKQKSAEMILVDLYRRFAEGSKLQPRQSMLFQVLQDKHVSQDTLDELLKLARLDSLGSIELFAWYGPAYIPDYFKVPQSRRSHQLHRQFVTLVEASLNLQKQTPERLLVEKIVLLSILWIWLSAPGADEAEQISPLIQAIHPEPSETASILTAFGETYMLARKPGLTALCLDLGKRLFQHEIHAAEKLLVLLTLLPPEVCPPSPNQLPPGEVLDLINAANLADTRVAREELQATLGEQHEMPARRTRDLVNFLGVVGRPTDGLFQRLQPYLQKRTGRIGKLASALQPFLAVQPDDTNYQPGELELFLEAQERRLDLAQGQQNQEETRPAAYLHYLLLPATEQVKKAEPFKAYYTHYLREFHVDGFIQRAQTYALLTILSDTSQMIDHSQGIKKLAGGWIDMQDFLTGCQNIVRVPMVPQVTAEADSSELTRELLEKLEESWQALHTKPEGIAPDVHRKLVGVVASTLAPCITRREYLVTALNVARLSMVKKQNQDYWLELLREMSKQTSTNYWHRPDVELLLPYIETLPRLQVYFAQIQGQEKEKFCFEVWDTLLQQHGSFDAQVLRQIEERDDKWHKSVKSTWQKYKQARQLQVYIEDQDVPPVQPVLPAIPEQPAILQVQPAPPEPVTQPAALSGIRLWWKSLTTIGKLRRAIKRAERARLYMLWKDEHALLLRYQERVEPAYWRRFAEILQFDEAFQALPGPFSTFSPAESSMRKQRFLSCVDACQSREQKEGWKACLLQEHKDALYQLRPAPLQL